MEAKKKSRMQFAINDMTKRHFVSRLPNYSLASILFRAIFVSLIAVFSLEIIWHTLNVGDTKPEIFVYLIVIMGFNVLSESNIILDNILEKLLPIPQNIRLRIKVQLVLTLLLVVLVHQITISFFDYQRDGQLSIIYISIATGLVFVTLMSSSLLITRLMEKWYYMQKQVETMKQEKLQMDYNALQDQLNPHFLFNNLSVLKSLIIYDKDKAVNFTQNFTDVYRYVLKSKDLKTIPLSEELKFITAYVKLHEERLGKGLKVEITIPKTFYECKVAPLALQLLVENAIKHNIVSRTLPLHIHIFVRENELIVNNNIQPREGSYSTHTGLQNLVKRYLMLANKEVRITSNEEEFEVSVPLLDRNFRKEETKNQL
jgi:two-component system LytT family sensor kinase